MDTYQSAEPAGRIGQQHNEPAPAVPASEPIAATAPDSASSDLAMLSPSISDQPAPDRVDESPVAELPAPLPPSDMAATPTAEPLPAIAPLDVPVPQAETPIAETPEVEETPLVARNVTSPSTVAPVARPEVAPSRDLLYPDTGLPPARIAVPEPDVVSEPAMADSESPSTSPSTTPGQQAWQEPDTLLARLDELTRHDATKGWATETGRLVRRLGPATLANPAEAADILRQLDQRRSEVSPLVAAVRNKTVAQSLSRAGHALERRLDVWTQLAQLQPSAPASANCCRPTPRRYRSAWERSICSRGIPRKAALGGNTCWSTPSVIGRRGASRPKSGSRGKWPLNCSNASTKRP